MIKKIFTHIARWNEWRKGHDSSWLFKLSVLIGFASPPPTYYLVMTPSEKRALKKSLAKLSDAAKEFGASLQQASMTLKVFSDDILKKSEEE